MLRVGQDGGTGRAAPPGRVVTIRGIFHGTLWGAAATLFLTQPYIGMSCSSFTLVVISMTTVFLSHHSQTQFSNAIASLEASAYLALGGGENDHSGPGDGDENASRESREALWRGPQGGADQGARAVQQFRRSHLCGR